MRTIQDDFREYAYLDRKRSEEAGITPREYQRWLLLRSRLERVFSQGPPTEESERRGSLRIPTRLAVEYDAEAGLAGTVTNLSRTGCYISTELPAPVGTHLTLILELATTGERLELSAEVVSIIAARTGRASDRGMGLRFQDVPPEDQKRLDDLYASLRPELPS